jgi:hypothetical protein
MMKTLAGLALIVIALAAYLALWPVPVEPVGWPAPSASGYTGPHAANQRLARLQHIDLKGEVGPEHVAIGPDGKLYTAVDGGKILRMNQDGSGQEVFARTGGRVLGFDFDAAGHMVGADAFQGLVSIAADGKVTVLTAARAGRKDLGRPGQAAQLGDHFGNGNAGPAVHPEPAWEDAGLDGQADELGLVMK